MFCVCFIFLVFLLYPGRKKLSRTQKVGEKLRLSVMLGGDEDRVQKDEDDDEPVERLTLHQRPHLEPSHTNQPVSQLQGH